MRVFKSLRITAAVAMMAPASVLAQQGGITYDCDTAADHFSELVLPAPAVPFTVKGRVQLNQIASIAKFAPLTRISITNAPAEPGQAPDNSAGFELTALPAKFVNPKLKDSKTILQFLSWDERSSGVKKSHEPSAMPERANAVPFVLTYNGSAVIARIDDREQTIPLSIKEPVVRLVCSTGEFLYTDLKIEPLK